MIWGMIQPQIEVQAIQDLATRENVRIARVNSQIDSYFAVETRFRKNMR